MSRRTALWLTGSAMLALAIVLLVLDRQLTDTGGPSILGFEFAGSRGRVDEILADWGNDGHDAALASLWIDYLYMAAYGAFWALTAAATRDPGPPPRLDPARGRRQDRGLPSDRRGGARCLRERRPAARARPPRW